MSWPYLFAVTFRLRRVVMLGHLCNPKGSCKLRVVYQMETGTKLCTGARKNGRWIPRRDLATIYKVQHMKTFRTEMYHNVAQREHNESTGNEKGNTDVPALLLIIARLCG